MPDDIIKSTSVQVPITAEIWADAEVWHTTLERCYQALADRLREGA